MARRTKEEAEKTREAILDAAEQVFMENGVARTSLHQIATVAGVTRGAVYWHFRDKMALIHAMADRVMLPEEAFLDDMLAKDSSSPIEALQQVSTEAMRHVLGDPHHRRVVSILSSRCEYIDEMSFLSMRQVECMERIVARFQRVFDRAKRLGQLAACWTPASASYALYCFFYGLIAVDVKCEGQPVRGQNPVVALEGFFNGLKKG